jgi:hydroxypyruvate isomerase
MCDTIAWSIEAVGSPNAKLVYDVYHMQVMEADVTETIRTHAQWFRHYHKGGVSDDEGHGERDPDKRERVALNSLRES